VTKRGERTRAKLIEATLAVVAEVGYARASTRSISDAAGVAEGTLYRHFPDKTSLFFAAALAASPDVVEWVEALPGRAGRDSVEANLAAALERLATLQERVLPLEIAIRSDPELAAQRQAIVATQGFLPGPPRAIAAYLAAEQALGRVRSDIDPEEVALVILAMLFGMAIAAADDPAPLATERVSSALHVFVRGILPS
jgi:AcrR family transcriptional regulator